MKIRDLKAEEIEVRVGTCSDKGVSLLLYKDARVDARILDETFGPFRWQCRFYEIKGTLYCSVGVYSDAEPYTGWLWKDDAGSPSNMEAEKGEASDAFKRACFKWGIGRELYSAPFIWVPAEKANIKAGRSGKAQCFDKFEVAKVITEDGIIKKIAIRNAKTGKVVYVNENCN